MSNLKGINTEGLLTDIYEDEGYDHWDLLITVLETLCTDVNKAIQEDDKDHIYALINLLNSCDPDNLYRFLPKEGTPYDPDRCKELGEYRLEPVEILGPTENTFYNPLSITVGDLLNKGGKLPNNWDNLPGAYDPVEPEVLNKPSSYPTVPENDNYFMAHHYPEDYKIPQAINNALVQAMWWTNIDIDKSVNKQAANVYLLHVPHAILEGHEMGMGVTPIARIESGLKTQILYILANLQGWRGEEAKRCKRILKAFATTHATSGDPLDY